MSDYCLAELNNCMSLEPCNSMNIVLIPKISYPKSLSNFRPISLGTILYKIILKTVANHFQKVLDWCIDQAQSVFVLMWLISNNFLLVYEVLHSFKRERTSKKGYMGLKLDMSKIYNRVEWLFLQEITLKIGFDWAWVAFILHCLLTVTYLINLNGKQRPKFQAFRGLRQRDPLSPYLFLICSENLSTLIRLAINKGSNIEAKMTKGHKYLIFFLQMITYCLGMQQKMGS